MDDHLLDHGEWRMDAQGVKLEGSDQPGFGVRTLLHRSIQTRLDNHIADLSPGGGAPGDMIVAGVRDAPPAPHRPQGRR
ncbi:hypothetical protein ACFU3E_25590 [Streptomyces sp. NPDC057424]|uniref:hypothetical protein n=1 Tax=Streptomyces sp. NPDC057424 TaxID=3346127 RepID=UPI0036CB728D